MCIGKQMLRAPRSNSPPLQFVNILHSSIITHITIPDYKEKINNEREQASFGRN